MSSQVADSVNNHTAGLTGGVDWGDLLTGGGGDQIRQTHKNMILHFIISLYIYICMCFYACPFWFNQVSGLARWCGLILKASPPSQTSQTFG